MIRSFAELMQEALRLGPKTIAVAAADEHEVLQAVSDAQVRGLARCILVGDEVGIHQIAAESGADISEMPLINEPEPREASRRVMQLVSQGDAQIAMKGKVETSVFLLAALDREANMRTGALFTHVGAFEIPGFERLILVSDAGVVVSPTLEQKVEIVRNAICVANRLGIQTPRVAVLAAAEMVNPKIPATLDAASLSKMADRGQIVGGLVDGPLALDTAISEESAVVKGIRSEVAGHADILIPPDIEAGNVLAKAISYFAKGRMAGVVVGARRPLIVASRADPHDAKLHSMALGVLMSE